ncbi:MAG: hypothetical protein KGV56_05895 [Gammaproteobacteria bacterium]|nr:hypothetical protein [Gammaproteobacteria bacterium]
MYQKIVKSAVLISLLLVNIGFTKEKNSWIREGIKGKVKSYTQITFNPQKISEKIKLSDKKCEMLWCIKTYFSDDGNITKKIHYYPKWDNTETIYKYNSNNQIVSSETYEIDDPYKFMSMDRWHYQYDNKGNNIGKIHYYGPQTIAYTSTFDDKGNEIMTIVENNDDLLRSNFKRKFTYKYDNANNQIEEKKYNDSDEAWVSKNIDIYNSLNKKVESKFFDKTNKMKYRFTYSYDNKGNMIQFNYYEADGKLYEKTVYKYDRKGNIIKSTRYKNGNVPIEIIEWKYEYYE